jgi:hypothetical protein
MAKRKVAEPTVGVPGHFFVKHTTQYDHEKEEKIPPPLTKQESAKVPHNVDMMRQHVPDAEVFIKELYAEHMIDGFRAIVSVTKLRRAA